MKRGVVLRLGFLLTSFCLVLVYVMASWTIGTFRSQDMDSESSPSFLSDVESVSSLMTMDTSGSGNNGPRKYIDKRIVHLDLKGMPMLPKYMAEVFPLLKRLGATGILIEYEDMFPFEDALKSVRHKDAYTKEDIQYLNHLAQANNLEVIPLVQTFGHMEYILKLEEFASLREVPKYPQVICPTQNASLALIRMMIDQVISLHPNSRYIHIGSDEVYFLGMCPLCTHRMATDHLVEYQIFIEHVKYVAQYVTEKYNPLRVVMWDDEFRKLEEDAIVSSGLAQLVDIIVWNYGPDVSSSLPPPLWEKYSRAFKHIWIGSAFKGADKPDSMVANETLYLTNHYSWISVANEQSAAIKFEGLVLTGWQRYDHFSVLCELFPVAIPSLVSSLTYVTSTKFLQMNDVFSIVKYILGCGSGLDYCSFPGSRVHDHVKELQKYQMQLEDLKKTSIFRGWLTPYNRQLRFSSPSLVENALMSLTRLDTELKSLKKQLNRSLAEVFPKSSIEEWMAINFDPLHNEVQGLYTSANEILDKKYFPVRPLSWNSTPPN